MTYFVEIRAAVRRTGAPKLVPLEQVDKYTGFRSAVAYDAETAALIREMGGTRDLRGIPVYAEYLFMDFDDHSPDEFLAWLETTNLAYERYDSGNRSVHVHIPLVPVFGSWVPAALKAWTKKQAPTADISFLHPSGQYRLPGTYHPKQPGRRKELLAIRMGEPLELQQPSTSRDPLVFTFSDEGDEQDFYRLLTQAKGSGHRSMHLWRLATCAAEIGMEFQEALEHLRFWNDNFAMPPHPEDVLEKQCHSAYQRLARRNE